MPERQYNRSSRSRARYREMRRKRARRRRMIRLTIIAGMALLIFLSLFLIIKTIFGKKDVKRLDVPIVSEALDTLGGSSKIPRPELDVQLLSISDQSRPGIAMEEVNGIVIHYTGNPNTSAMNNRNYFESLAQTQEASASSHFIVGMEGEIVQCIPSGEISYASNNRNSDTISIECCHVDATGKFSKDTYDSLVELSAWLCQEFDLQASDLMRHYDVTGKECPRYYVENENEWDKLVKDVDSRLKR